MTRSIGPGWNGYATIDNLEAIATAIRTLLAGRRYVFIAVNESYPYRVDARTGQRLSPEKATSRQSLRVWYNDDVKHPATARFGGLTAIDTYGTWGITTSARDTMKVNELDTLQTPYISFDGRGEHAKIQIRHYNGMSEVLNWTIAVEAEPDADATWWPRLSPERVMERLTQQRVNVTACYMDGGTHHPYWVIAGYTSGGEFAVLYDDTTWSVRGDRSMQPVVEEWLAPILGGRVYRERPV